MRIRFLMSSDRVSGAAEPMVTLAKGLQESGHEVHFSCKKVKEWSSKPLDTFLEAQGLSWDTSLRLDNRIQPLAFIRDVLELSRQLRKKPVDILHCHYRTDHWIGALAARRSGTSVRVLRSRHHSKPERGDRLHRWLFQRLTHGIAEISEATLQANRTLLQLKDVPHRVIFGGIPEALLDSPPVAAALHKELGLPDNAILLGYPARLVAKRRPVELVEALAPLLKAHPELFLLLVGRGPLETELIKLAAHRHLSRQVHILGYREDFLSVVQALNMVVYVREGTDGGCRALLEAMALGRPIVVPAYGPLPEIIGKSGLVCPDSSEGLRLAVESLLTHPSEATRLGERARIRATECFTADHRLREYERLYREVLERA